MSVLLETSLGDITIDLHYEKAPRAAENFLKLCKIKYYNFVLFHNVQKGFMAQAGDPTATGKGGESVWGVIHGSSRRYFIPEMHPKLKHKTKGTVSFATAETNEAGLPVAGSQFFITLTDNHLDYLDGKQAVFGKVVEGLEVLDEINKAMCDDDGRPYRDIRIKHTIILDDPFDDPEGLLVPDRSPIPTGDMLKTGRIGEDEELVPDLPPEELEKREREQEAAARAITLEMMGDLPFAEIKPPENIVFVCKLNPVTRDEDLEIIFSRFGTILSCEVIRDQKTGDSLCYAFIEFDNKESAEEAYFKMDNVLIDDRRIHVDFSQSVSKLHHDFMRGERRGLADGEGFGGSRGLEKRRKYRDEDERHDDYDLVFEHGDDLDAEKQRVKRYKVDDSDKSRSSREGRDRESGRGGRDSDRDRGSERDRGSGRRRESDRGNRDVEPRSRGHSGRDDDRRSSSYRDSGDGGHRQRRDDRDRSSRDSRDRDGRRR